MLEKPGKNPSFPQNYRPISLKPFISKVVEKVLERAIDGGTSRLGLISDEQFGFRKEHSTTDKALKLAEKITYGFQIKEAFGMLLLDIQMTFDKV